MKLQYWVCECLDDSSCYNIRTKTKKEAVRLREANGGAERFGPPTKVILEYEDGFDLMMNCMGEGGPYGLSITPGGWHPV